MSTSQKKDARKGRNKKKNVATVPIVKPSADPYANLVPADLYDLDNSEDEFERKEAMMMRQALKEEARRQAMREQTTFVGKAQEEKTEAFPPLSHQKTSNLQEITKQVDCQPASKTGSPPQQEEPLRQTGPGQKEGSVQSFSQALTQIPEPKWTRIKRHVGPGQKEGSVKGFSQALIQIPEPKCLRIKGKVEVVSRQEGERAALLYEVELLKKQLRTQEEKADSEKAQLLAEVSNQQQSAKEAVLEMEKLKEDCEKERQNRREMEEQLARQTDMNSTLQADMSHAIKDMQAQIELARSDFLSYKEECVRLRAAQEQSEENHRIQKQQWEQEKSSLHSYKEESDRLKAALEQVQEDHEIQRQQWEQEKSSLLSYKEDSCKLKAALEQAEEEMKTKKQRWQKDRFCLHREHDEAISKIGASLKKAQEELKNQRCQQEKERQLFLTGHQQLDQLKHQWEEHKIRVQNAHKEEISFLRAVLGQTKEDLSKQTHQREELRSQLLAEREKSFTLEASLHQASMDLQKHKLQWQEATLLESISVIRSSTAQAIMDGQVETKEVPGTKVPGKNAY
ncbi:Hypothetical predicted protein [Xyrichtys novacula]|uniref:Uncharacterized protein n=1 Tax=Xyrichtys novacula TaxID=13765 RepID=A0AAV1GXB7_XYRNO|nr:Hypothetical predicted protein [Xyrichtys novacula]